MFWSATPSYAAGGRIEQILGGGQEIFGRVVDGCGRPLVRADVAIVRTRPVVGIPLIAVYTDARGRYWQPTSGPARYWITVRPRGAFRPQTKSVRVRAGRTARLNFRFRRCVGGPALAG
jgi:hypothetical protein